MRPLLGAHVPVAGGLPLAPERAKAIAAEAIQVFTRSHRQWRARSVEAEEAAAFREAVARNDIRMVPSHASYLLNLASPDHALLEKSREAFVAEMERCRALGIAYVDLATPRGYRETFAAFDRVVGLARLKAFHLNDAKRELGSQRDRHAGIGQGLLGLPTFRRLLCDRRFGGLPMVLETPGGLVRWKKELRLLRRLARPSRDTGTPERRSA